MRVPTVGLLGDYLENLCDYHRNLEDEHGNLYNNKSKSK